MTDFSSLLQKINTLKAQVEQSSITPVYLGSILDDFLTTMQSIDMSAMSDDIQNAINDAAVALSKATQALSTARSLDESKGQPNGIAPLDATGKISSQYLPALSNPGISGVADLIGMPDGIAPLNEFGKIPAEHIPDDLQKTDERGQPEGYAPLDEYGKVPAEHLPAIELPEIPEGVNTIVIDTIADVDSESIQAASYGGTAPVIVLDVSRGRLFCESEGMFYPGWSTAGDYGTVDLDGVIPFAGKTYVARECNRAYYVDGKEIVQIGVDPDMLSNVVALDPAMPSNFDEAIPVNENARELYDRHGDEPYRIFPITTLDSILTPNGQGLWKPITEDAVKNHVKEGIEKAACKLPVFAWFDEDAPDNFSNQGYPGNVDNLTAEVVFSKETNKFFCRASGQNYAGWQGCERYGTPTASGVIPFAGAFYAQICDDYSEGGIFSFNGEEMLRQSFNPSALASFVKETSLDDVPRYEEADNEIEEIEPNIVTNALRKTEQHLTEEEKVQVKKNLGINKEELIAQWREATKIYIGPTNHKEQLGDYDEEEDVFTYGGLVNLTEAEVRAALAYKVNLANYVIQAYRDCWWLRATVPLHIANGTSMDNSFAGCRTLEIVAIYDYYQNAAPSNVGQTFMNCKSLKYILGVPLNFNSISTPIKYTFLNCNSLEIFWITNLKTSMDIHWSPNIRPECLSYLIENAVNTESITITVHEDIYDMLSDETNTEWHSLLTAALDKDIQFATI